MNCHIYIKAEALMFFHIYAYLVMLTKSNSLSKPVIDVNTHWLLRTNNVLPEVANQFKIVMDKRCCYVFRSEHHLRIWR